MDLGRSNTTTEYRELIGMFQYYKDIWTRWFNVLAPTTDADSEPKCRKTI